PRTSASPSVVSLWRSPSMAPVRVSTKRTEPSWLRGSKRVLLFHLPANCPARSRRLKGGGSREGAAGVETADASAGVGPIVIAATSGLLAAHPAAQAMAESHAER